MEPCHTFPYRCIVRTNQLCGIVCVRTVRVVTRRGYERYKSIGGPVVTALVCTDTSPYLLIVYMPVETR
ncbi:MAG: hypothetical protein JRG73_16445 [Deltaproteobacteria bacterium]|nr:hypothetical protein [Deltaproteobacteria bacterium]